MEDLLKTIKKTIENLITSFQELFNKLFLVIKNKVDELQENKKWKLYLYLHGQCIKCLKIDKNFAPMNKIYVIKVRNLKHLIGTNKKMQLVVRSYKYKCTEGEAKKSHIEVIIHDGNDIG